jgi:Fe-S-cluster-containing hydrogenase component 2
MVVRKLIEIDEDLCTGCGQCVTSCAEGALEIVNGKAKVVRDRFCDGLGACIGECPEGALKIVERDVAEFDEAAVKEHMTEKAKHEKRRHIIGTSCPSAQPQILRTKHHAGSTKERESLLGQWPIQLMLVPETAPFLRDKELVVLADCAAVAYANLHERFIGGKAIVMGCPKFDNAQIYLKKLVGMIKNGGIKGLTVVHMEVPCCFGLQKIVEEAVSASGTMIPFHEIVVGIRGDILESQ